MRKKLRNLIIFISFVFSIPIFAQDIVGQITEEKPILQTKTKDDLFVERLLKISPSRRIFVITNNNSALFKGDFFSILLDNQLVARALVAKQIDETNAIKIMKIYSLVKWESLRVGMDLQILKGDDSFFRLQNEGKDDNIIKDEDDLFNDTLLDEDITLEEKTNRIIKPDNIASFQYGQVETVDNDFSARRYEHWNGAWGYQVADNVWAEFQIGRSSIGGFPADGLSTILTSYTGRLKFTIKGPWYSYIMPYAGYMQLDAVSDDAGVVVRNTTTGVIENDADEELELLDSSTKAQVIFGVTILKRFVPGWFLRVDVGSDIVNGGLALEF